MCCFSSPVQSVTKTRIFARVAGHRQFLVYSMRLATPVDVAMVLPIPVARGGDLKFVDLSDYPTFFNDMARCFPAPFTNPMFAPRAVAAGPIKVEQVGSFDASFVPSMADFDRVDPRFRLPTGVWDALPGYADFGFAVFKIRQGEHNVHPMAFSFETRAPEEAFFPTVHIHDGEVHPTAAFDHELYLQRELAPATWEHSSIPACQNMRLGNVLAGDLTRGIVDARMPLHRIVMNGELRNQDVAV